MKGKAFVDTNVLVYALAHADGRTETAEAVLAAGGVVSVQVLNEFTAISRRKLGFSWQDVSEAVAAIKILCPSPVPMSIALHDEARRLAEDYGFTIYDALIAAAALEARCTTLYSEDFQNGQVIEETITVRNPFV